jgi:hypothetical protein
VHYHAAYGVTLACDHAIPGLAVLPREAAADVMVKLGRLPPTLEPAELMRAEPRYVSSYLDADGTPVLKLWKADPRYFLLRYCEGIQFAVDEAGTEIWGNGPEKLSLDHTALYLRGPVMSFVLGLRGLVCLHASAVVIDGRAVGFAGPPSAGKSTTAAAFTQRGFAGLSDDILAISANGGGFVVQPGYPRLCLWPGSAAALGRPMDDLPRLVPDDEKRYIQLEPGNGSFHDEPAPLGAIYILSPRAAGSCEAGVAGLQGADELLSLLANNYGTGLLDRERRAKEFAVLGRVANEVPVRKAHAPRDPGSLGELCDVILRDFRASLEKK